MGYLTTITISNDDLDVLKANQEEFVDKLLMHCISGFRGNDHFSVGWHTNSVILQRPRHADDPTVYVHMGNTVVEMNSYCIDTKDMADKHPEYFDRVLKFLEGEVKELKKFRKKSQAGAGQ